jgi:hypothetical protein
LRRPNKQNPVARKRAGNPSSRAAEILTTLRDNN